MPASSMEPTINKGDLVIVKRLGFGTYGTYGITLIDKDIKDNGLMERGEIYVFYPPIGDKPFIKRLIALPSDNLELTESYIMVNGNQLDQNIMPMQFGDELIYEERLAGKAYYIKKTPSRVVPKRIKIKIPANSYYFVGDNREKSADSRTFGPISGSDIVGKLIHIFYNGRS